MTERVGSTSSYFAPAGNHDENATTKQQRRSRPPADKNLFGQLPESPMQQKRTAAGEPAMPVGGLATYLSQLNISERPPSDTNRAQTLPALASQPGAKSAYYQQPGPVHRFAPRGFASPTAAQAVLHASVAPRSDLRQSPIRAGGATFPAQPSSRSGASSLFELAEAHYGGERLERSLLSDTTLTFVLSYIGSKPPQERPELALKLAADVISEATKATQSQAQNRHNIRPTLYNVTKSLLDFDLDSEPDDARIERALNLVHFFAKQVGIVPEDAAPFVGNRSQGEGERLLLHFMGSR